MELKHLHRSEFTKDLTKFSGHLNFWLYVGSISETHSALSEIAMSFFPSFLLPTYPDDQLLSKNSKDLCALLKSNR